MRGIHSGSGFRFVCRLLCFTLLLQGSGIAQALPAMPVEKTWVTAQELEDWARPGFAKAGERDESAPMPNWLESLLGSSWTSVIDRAEELATWAEARWPRKYSTVATAAEPAPRIASIHLPLTAALAAPFAAQEDRGPYAFARDMPPSPPNLSTAPRRSSAAVGQFDLKATPPDVPFLPGFNLISIPNEPSDPDPGVVLGPISGQFTRAFAYDACDPVDPWKLYDPADPGASDLTAIDHRIGLWLEAGQAGVLPVGGTQPPVTQIQLCTGWNLIGYPLAQGRPVAAALASIEGKYTRVFGFDLSDFDDPWEVYSVGVPSWANDLDSMRSGRGYWVLATENTVLDYENAGAPPIVEITSPADVSEVTQPTDVLATVQSNSLDRWTLSYRPSGEPGAAFVEISSGDVPLQNSLAGSFDPTLLLNGLYDLKLEVVDFAGQIVEDVISVAVDGRRKIGNFTLTFTDLEIPLAGLDIQIVRTYDSRDKQKRDFGVGWALEIFQGSYRNNLTPGRGWQIQPGSLPCQSIQETEPHLTAVRLSDDEIYRFRLNLFSPAVVLGGCFAKARFDFVEGPLRGATLDILGNTDVIYQNGSNQVIDANELEVYEPRLVRLTTGDGRIFDLDLEQGVTRIQDLNENTLTVTPAGIDHSSGEGIDFERDSMGRITRITDPASNTIEYAYDGSGDLISVQDQVGAMTRFTYDGVHLLTDIEDPRGVNAIRNEYDEDGRLIAVTDANGNRTEFTHDLEARREVVRDRRGNVTISSYDDTGNVVARTDALGGTATFSYDARGNKLTHTLETGGTSTFAYDLDGNVLGETNEVGSTRSYTYDTNNRPLTITDPAWHGHHLDL